MGDEEKTPEQLAEEAAKAEEAKKAEETEAAKKAEEVEATKKAEEAKKAEEDKKKAADLGQMSPEQVKALEQQTGLTRQQMIAVGMIVNTALATGATAEIAESHAVTKASKELEGMGVKDFSAFEKDVRADLSKQPVSQRTNSELIRNLYWIKKGQKASGLGPAPDKPKAQVLHTGAETNTNEQTHDNTNEDLASLSKDEQSIYKLFKFENVKQFRSFQQNRDLEGTAEESFVPVFK